MIFKLYSPLFNFWSVSCHQQHTIGQLVLLHVHWRPCYQSYPGFYHIQDMMKPDDTREDDNCPKSQFFCSLTSKLLSVNE